MYYCQFILYCYTAFIFVSFFFTFTVMHECVNGEMLLRLVVTGISINVERADIIRADIIKADFIIHVNCQRIVVSYLVYYILLSSCVLYIVLLYSYY